MKLSFVFYDHSNYLKIQNGRHLDLIHLIWTKFGMAILVDPRNKHVEEFLIFLKIQAMHKLT